MKKLILMPAILLAMALVFAGCDLDTISSNTPANTSESSPYGLTDGSWFNGNLAVEGDKIWFSFDVTNGTTYSVYQEDRYNGSKTKTCDIMVSAKYSGTSAWIFGSTTSGWDPSTNDNSPRTFTADRNGKVLLLVQVSSQAAEVDQATGGNTSTGTFAIKYESQASSSMTDPSSATSLTLSTWVQGNLPYSSSEAWYSFNVTSGTTYHVWARERFTTGVNPSDGYASVYISAKYQNGPVIFENSISGVNSSTAATASGPASNFQADRSGRVYVRITPLSSYTGIFKVAVSTSSTRPSGEVTAASGSESNPISLTASAANSGIWHEDRFYSSTEKVWFKFSVNSGTTYNVYWDDYDDGSGQETADIQVSAKYQGDPSFTIVNARDSGYNTPLTFMASKNGTVLLMVERHPSASSFSDPTGTFAIAYTTGATARPSITPGE